MPKTEVQGLIWTLRKLEDQVDPQTKVRGRDRLFCHFLTSEALDLRDCLLPPIGALPTSQACGTLASAMIPQLEGIGRVTGICMPYRQPVAKLEQIEGVH